MKTESFTINTTGIGLHGNHIILEGKLLIRNAAAIKKELMSALSNSQNLEIILKNVARTDMAFLQLLVALKKAALTARKKISIIEEPAGYVTATLDNCGLLFLLNNFEQ